MAFFLSLIPDFEGVAGNLLDLDFNEKKWFMS
jgi:hypothetical protein